MLVKVSGKILKITILVLVILYFFSIFLPYIRQGDVSSSVKESFRLSDFYAEDPSSDSVLKDANFREKAASAAANTDSSEVTQADASKEEAKILLENQEALEERLRLIAGAKERIILSTFDFKDDNSGTYVLSALYDAAMRGVKVQVLIDGFSYLTHAAGRTAFLALGSLENATIKVYNPVHFLKPYTWMARLHDKYLVVDDHSYILGGRNTFDYFLGNQTDHVNYDWDVLVHSTAGDDASLPRLKAYFQTVWDLPECKIVMDKVSSRKKDKVAAAAGKLELTYVNLEKEHADWLTAANQDEFIPVDKISLMTNPINAGLKEPVLFYTMTELMLQAKEPVRIHTPYIICNDYMLERLDALGTSAPDVSTLRASSAAGKTTVETRISTIADNALSATGNSAASTTIMTNSAANNGNPFGAATYLMQKKNFLKSKIQLLEYDSGVSYHGKCFTIGDRLSAVGSFNWDRRSAYLDTEIMMVVDSKAFNRALSEAMEKYESDALVVKDSKNYILKEGQVPLKLSFGKKAILNLMRPLCRLFGFLM